MIRYIKKETKFTLFRDSIRLFFVVLFYFIMKYLHVEFELEIEFIVLLSVVVFGPLFCGFACPFGGAMYFTNRIGNSFSPKLQFNIPEKIDKKLRWLRYIFLIAFLYLFIVLGVNYFGDHIQMYKSTQWSFAFLQAKHWFVLGVSFFIPYFFCKYLCWQKALYNILNKIFKTTKIIRDDELCSHCKKCEKVCPMSIKIESKEKISGTDDCLSCFNCLDEDVCSKKKALSFKFFNKKVSYIKFAVISFLIYIITTYIFLYVLIIDFSKIFG